VWAQWAWWDERTCTLYSPIHILAAHSRQSRAVRSCSGGATGLALRMVTTRINALLTTRAERQDA
jgi:hypothetical protein